MGGHFRRIPKQKPIAYIYILDTGFIKLKFVQKIVTQTLFYFYVLLCYELEVCINN